MSSRPRFFVPPDAVRSGSVHFSRDQARQMSSVLRLTSGASVIALDNSGWQYDVTLDSVSGMDATGVIRSRSLVSSEPRTKITLYVALIRAPKLEIVLQKCTELGVAAFVPVSAQRCVVGASDELGPTKLERWQRIVVEAAEQSGRGKLPVISPPLRFGQACEQVRGVSFLLWEGECELPLRRALDGVIEERSVVRGRAGASASSAGSARPFSVNVFVGPEGGFTSDEVEQARAAGVVPVTLGPRILRAETASIAVASAVLFAQGDLG